MALFQADTRYLLKHTTSIIGKMTVYSGDTFTLIWNYGDDVYLFPAIIVSNIEIFVLSIFYEYSQKSPNNQKIGAHETGIEYGNQNFFKKIQILTKKLYLQLHELHRNEFVRKMWYEDEFHLRFHLIYYAHTNIINCAFSIWQPHKLFAVEKIIGEQWHGRLAIFDME